MQKETNLRSFIIHKGLKQYEFFDKILPFFGNGKRKPFSPAEMSRIVSGTKIHRPKLLYDAIQTAFELSSKEIEELKNCTVLIDYSNKEENLKLNSFVTQADLDTLIDIGKVMKDRLTLDFAIKTLTELVRQKQV